MASRLSAICIASARARGGIGGDAGSLHNLELDTAAVGLEERFVELDDALQRFGLLRVRLGDLHGVGDRRDDGIGFLGLVVDDLDAGARDARCGRAAVVAVERCEARWREEVGHGQAAAVGVAPRSPLHAGDALFLRLLEAEWVRDLAGHGRRGGRRRRAATGGAARCRGDRCGGGCCLLVAARRGDDDRDHDPDNGDDRHDRSPALQQLIGAASPRRQSQRGSDTGTGWLARRRRRRRDLIARLHAAADASPRSEHFPAAGPSPCRR